MKYAIVNCPAMNMDNYYECTYSNCAHTQCWENENCIMKKLYSSLEKQKNELLSEFEIVEFK